MVNSLRKIVFQVSKAAKVLYIKLYQYFCKLKKTKLINIYTIAIVLFSLFMFYPFLKYYIYGDDTAFHYSNVLIRGSDLYYTFSKILPTVANDLGYATGIFYPILPHALGGLILNIINVFGFGPFAALKMVKLITIILSGIFMYLFANKLYKNKLHACLTALIYISSSYFYVDMYSRDALNESFVFVFIPLIFLGIYYLFNEKNKLKFYLCFVIGYVGMMYSHLVMSVWFTLLFIAFLILFFKKIFTKENFIHLFISAILILIFTSPFTLPLVEHLLNGEYAIFNTTYGKYLETLSLKSFFVKNIAITGGNNVLFVNFQLIVLLLFIISFVKMIKNKIPKERKLFIIGCLIFGILGIFFTCCDFIWEFVPSFLKNIQLPWRTALFATFGICIFAGEGLDYFFLVFKKKFIPIVSLLFVIVLAFGFYYNLKDARLFEHKSFNVSNDAMGWQKEYLPSETKKNLEYFNNRKSNKIIITKGDAKARVIYNKTPNLSFEIYDLNKTSTLELPRLYYLGYDITNENGDSIKYYKNKNGFIAIDITKEGKYFVSYTGTLAYKLSLIVILITLLIIMIVVFYFYKKKRVLIKE